MASGKGVGLYVWENVLDRGHRRETVVVEAASWSEAVKKAKTRFPGLSEDDLPYAGQPRYLGKGIPPKLNGSK